MASPPIPPVLGHLAARPFSFYPPIVNVEHNEWVFRKATWSELVVVNHKTGEELSIPRHFISDTSSIDHPIVIVGLNRELEHRDGAVWPYQRRVIEMPLAVGETAPRRHNSPAPVVAIRLEERKDRRAVRILGSAISAALLVLIAASNVARLAEVRQRSAATHDRSFLDLTARDDYSSVVKRLGFPSQDRRHVPYRALSYSSRRFTVILMNGGYIGTMDSNWNPIHSVGLASGDSTFALLRGLKRF